jgi:membrane-associated phospholipid phosphatase
MRCRNCGTEIADKAIVCYRCGAGTTDPVRKPAPIKTGGGGWPPLVAAILPLLISLVLVLFSGPSGHPTAMTTAAGLLAALGAVLLIARLVRRR